jgi:hypothetical protein
MDSMTKILVTLALAVLVGAGVSGWAQEAKQTPPILSKESQAAAKAEKAQKPLPSQEELEAKFKSMLTKATLSGRWASTSGGVLGPEKEDKYTIESVGKVSGDSWVVNAKIKYNDREFIAPLPIKVRFAGDTPVIIVDDLAMPGGTRSYSARVMIYEHTYAGTWSGGEHSGMLYGTISNEKSGKATEQK